MPLRERFTRIKRKVRRSCYPISLLVRWKQCREEAFGGGKLAMDKGRLEGVNHGRAYEGFRGIGVEVVRKNGIFPCRNVLKSQANVILKISKGLRGKVGRKQFVSQSAPAKAHAGGHHGALRFVARGNQDFHPPILRQFAGGVK